MLGAGEFIAQVLPLFLQFVGLPIALGVAYYAYKNVYLPRKNKTDNPQTEAQKPATTQQVNQPASVEATIEPEVPDNLPSLDLFDEPEISSQTEDNAMSDQNQPEQNAAPQPRKIDTSDLPPLDMLLGTLDEEPQPEPAPPSTPDAPPEIVQLRQAENGVQHVLLDSGQIAPTREVITILRDEDDGKLIIQVGDTAYRTLADSADVKRLFTQVMKELATTITQPDSNPPARKRYVVGQPERVKPAPAPKPQPKPTPQPDSVSSIRELLIDEEENEPVPPPTAKKAPPPPPKSDGVMPGDLPSYKLDDNPIKTEKKGRFSSKTEAEALPELDLAGAIETYLQYKLQHTPEYYGRQIHIHGTPTGSIRIQVDDSYYDFVDEVADAEIRSFLQSTIAEWQDRQ